MLLLRLAIRMMPPQLTLFELATGGIVAQMLQQAIQLNIADRLDAGPMTAAELGTELNLRSDELHRMLRACSSAGVFSLDSAGRFSNNYLSRAMRSRVSGTFRDTVDYFTSPEINEVWTELPNTLRTGQGGYEQLHGCSVWEWYAQNPAAEARFARSMMGLSALDAQGIASARPFRQIKKLGDLGGGAGLILSEILRRNPQLQGVLLDAEGVLHIAQQLLTKRGVAERAELQPGSFFQDVPNGCDGLFLKNILHDWDDADVRTILGNCRSGLPVGGKLLLVEMLHEPNTPNRVSSISDVQMMMATARGRERSEAELASLLKEQGFELTRIHPLPGFQSLIEATAQPPAAAH
tara:strand:+ start:634 stop:1686 length:1053 start_codon:yes stop_codon:yes gene_type:complete